MENMDIIGQSKEQSDDAKAIEFILDKNLDIPITGIEYTELLNLKLRGSEKFSILTEMYFNKIKNSLLNVCAIHTVKTEELDAVFEHLKSSSSITYILQRLLLFIVAEFKKAENLKTPVLLKVFNSLLLNDSVSPEIDLGSYTYALVNFLTERRRNSLNFDVLIYLLKDITADILSELFCAFATDELKNCAVSQMSNAFRYPQECLKDLYGSAVGCFSNMTIENGAKCIHSEAFFSEIFGKRVVNSHKVLKTLACICEPFIYCCLPKEIVKSLQNETNSLYNLNIASIITYNLIRNEIFSTHIPVSLLKYDKRMSNKSLFLDLEEMKKTLLGIIKIKKVEFQSVVSYIEDDTSKEIENLYAYNICSSEMKDISLDCWDVFSVIEKVTDEQLVFFGYLSVENINNECFCENSGIYHVSSRVSASLDSESVNLYPMNGAIETWKKD